MKECALRTRSTHGVHHAIIEVNVVIGVVLGEVLVARVVPLVVDAVIGLALSLIAHVDVVVVFVVAILHRISCMGDILFTVCLSYCDKFLYRIMSDCTENSGDVRMNLEASSFDAAKKEKLSMAPYFPADKWIDVLSKGGGQKKRFQHCWKPNFLVKLLYLRAIQGHSGKAYSGNARINPALQDNVLSPKGFTKYVYHVGNGKELRSIVRNGLVPG